MPKSDNARYTDLSLTVAVKVLEYVELLTR